MRARTLSNSSFLSSTTTSLENSRSSEPFSTKSEQNENVFQAPHVRKAPMSRIMTAHPIPSTFQILLPPPEPELSPTKSLGGLNSLRNVMILPQNSWAKDNSFHGARRFSNRIKESRCRGLYLQRIGSVRVE